MYLVSVYFDEKTDRKIRGYIEKIAEKTGNGFMVDNHVPPHITVGSGKGADVRGLCNHAK